MNSYIFLTFKHKFLTFLLVAHISNCIQHKSYKLLNKKLGNETILRKYGKFRYG
jgi:hypothetical protein